MSQSRSSGKGLIVFGLLAAAGLFGFGWWMNQNKEADKALAQAQAAPVQNFFTQQQNLMRDAIDMAREAQAMQRENMARIRAEMEAAYGEESYFADVGYEGEGQ